MRNYLRLIRHEGNLSLFAALEASLVSLLGGSPLHVHAEGLRGTGKTTIIRAARQILPEILRIRGCPYNCDPGSPHCPNHAGLSPDEVSQIGVELVPMPFLEISHAAKVGTVVGSIDLGRIVDPVRPEAALLPGIIPRAHRGIVFVDEINRLADTSPELTDILLDIMGTKPGRLQLEETGLPTVELPVMVAVWAASNPDEEPGPLEDIRRQLSDRFDLLVGMGRPSQVDVVTRILVEGEREKGWAGGAPTESFEVLEARESILRRAGMRSSIRMTDELKRLLAEIYVDFGLESLRAVEAVNLGARAMAALEDRDVVDISHIKAVLPLALHHRVDLSTLSGILRFVEEWVSKSEARQRQPVLLGQGSPWTGDTGDPGKAESQRTESSERTEQGQERVSYFDREVPQIRESLWRKVMNRISGPSQAGGLRRPVGRVLTEQPMANRNGKLGNPCSIDPVAPPEKARPLFSLHGNELVRTEEDLRKV